MNEPKAARYQRLKRRAHIAGIASGVVLLAGVGLTPLARILADAVWQRTAWAPWPFHTAVAAACFALVLAAIWEMLVLPFVVYGGAVVDRRFGRADDADSPAAAHLRAALIRVPATLAGTVILMLSARLFDDYWWIAAGALSAALWVLAARLVPALLLTFGDTKPVARPSLMSALREIARRSGVRVTDILEWRIDEGSRATALVTGLGRTCRVFVSSEVLRDWSDDEIAVVVAHELAHHVHRDLWRGLLMNAAVLMLAFGTAQVALEAFSGPLALRGSTDLAALPVVVLMTALVWAIARPIRLAQSRAHERRADAFALDLTGEAGAFGAALRRLGKRHLVEHEPPALARWFFHRHPSLAERLAMAQAFKSPVGPEAKSEKPKVSRKMAF